MNKIKLERYFAEGIEVDNILEFIYEDKIDKILNDMISNSNINF